MSLVSSFAHDRGLRSAGARQPVLVRTLASTPQARTRSRCPDPEIIGVFAGALGVGSFVYGKKQERIVSFVAGRGREWPGVAGLGLCVLPYMIDNSWILIAVCVVLAVAPFVIRR